MEVAELYSLARWYDEQGQQAGRLYQQLLAVLQHNASQNQKQPVQGPLEELISGLKSQPMTSLSFQQVEQLNKMGVGRFLGVRGATIVEQLVTKSGYDPATSATEMQTATQELTNAVKLFRTLTASLKAANLNEDDEEELDAGTTMARIQFRHDASIGNIAEMKKWAAEWNDIARGIGHLVGEAPHNLKVVGASKGSIIVSVSGTIMLISALAYMSKKVSGIVLDGLRVQNAIEDLRHKRMSNSIIEKSLNDDLKKREATLEEEITTDLKERAGDSFKPEHDAHLRTAIRKYIDFSKKGGEVDYLQPPQPQHDDEDEISEGGPDQLVAELRQLISEVRSIKSDTLLLEDVLNDTAP
jgi:hypothetical protein